MKHPTLLALLLVSLAAPAFASTPTPPNQASTLTQDTGRVFQQYQRVASDDAGRVALRYQRTA